VGSLSVMGAHLHERRNNVSVVSKSFGGEASSIRMYLLELDTLGELVANL
jgi:hypothetical protein